MKKKIQNRLTKTDEAHLCKLWKERKQKLEKAVQEERELQGRIEMAQAELAADRKEQERMVKTLCAIEQSLVRETYEDLKEQMHTAEQGCLLLPSITCTDTDVSGISLVAARAHAQSLEKERNRLIAGACQYRDLAESFQKTNRHLRKQMYDNIETVRNFWRNSVLEQRTRGGRMVMASLRK